MRLYAAILCTSVGLILVMQNNPTTLDVILGITNIGLGVLNTYLYDKEH